ncbi:phage major capsid protein [Salinibacterium sp. ZJ450]|uniref:phage major capsid protein n=1 Tax=Salinibacterium sp. ZJ450 TaxID=2708338 RepID=UPI001421D58D|nr:phage major capsid protein [Salinibacterium sp. ZJ450]
MSYTRQPGSIRQQFDAARKAADDILAKAKTENRLLTDAEIKDANDAFDHAEELKPQLEKAEPSSALLDFVRGTPDRNSTSGLKAGAAWAASAADTLVKAATLRSPDGQPQIKALVGATVTVPTVVGPTATNPTRPLSILELIPSIVRPVVDDDAGNRFAYLYESVNTDTAKSVADNTAKPVSVVTMEERSDRYRVFATLSEAFPERFLSDYKNLVRILDRRLAEFVLGALEAAILSGDPATVGRDDFQGILNRTGVQVIPAVPSELIKTLSNAKLALETSFITRPTAWVMNPVDVQKLELLRETGTTGPFMFKSGRSQIESILGDIPIVSTTRITAGTALLGDFDQTLLRVADQMTVKVDGSGTLFDNNQVKLRVEGRFGFEVYRPFAFAKITLP